MKKPPEVPADASPGLITDKGAPVPLVGVKVEVKMRDLAVHTTVTQRFRNIEKNPIEAVYSFPLEEGSAVCGFEARIGDRIVKGRVEEREKAFETYNDALSRGDSAFLLDEVRPDIFMVSVGRLNPGEEADVRISHISRAESHDKGIRLRVPTTISPRYIPADMLKKADPAELDAILPPTSIWGVPYGLALSVDIAAGSPIRTISCPSHPVEVSVKGRKAAVSLAGKDVQLDSDFVLNVELEKPLEPRVVACHDGEGYALMVRLKPEFPPAKAQPCDVIFILDRSGSMQGESIREARAALLLGIKSLREGDRFDVIGFGTGSERVFGKLTDYDDESAEKAVAATSTWEADLGGTEILQPLRTALLDTTKSRPACIFLLTDGEVGNESEVIALARKYRSRCRIFSFGIGRGASATLIKGVARASGGLHEFIYPGERIEPKVMRQVARIYTPMHMNTRLDWGALEPDAATPAELPPFCEGDEVIAFARVPALKRTSITLSVEGMPSLAKCRVAITKADLEDDDTVALLMARSLITDLETGGLVDSGSAQQGRRKDTRKNQLLETALRYGLASSQTSFVAVEHRADADPSMPVELRRVPVALTQGWGGISISIPISAGLCGFIGIASATYMNALAPKGTPPFLRRIAKDEMLPIKKQKIAEPHEPLLALVALQRTNGSWKLDKRLAALAGTKKKDLEKLAATSPEVLATLTALYLLWTKHPDREDEWRPIADKAIAWLAKQGFTPTLPTAAQKLEDWLTTQMKAAGN